MRAQRSNLVNSAPSWLEIAASPCGLLAMTRLHLIARNSENRRLNDAMSTDLSHLPPSTPEEIRAMTRNAGLDLPEELMQQFIAVWPAFEAMVRRIPRSLDRAAEPAHSYRPLRIVRG